jgi:hypothetical protein
MSDYLTHKIFVEYDWKTFMKASLELFSTNSISSEYSLLSDYCTKYKYNDNLVIKFIENAYEKESIIYDYCTMDILITCFDGYKYSEKYIPYKAIDFLYEKDAPINEFVLLGRRIGLNDSATLEEHCADAHIRALLIDKYYNKMELRFIDPYNIWKNIKAEHWSKLDTSKLYFVGNNDKIEYIRKCNLKHYSKFLKITFPYKDYPKLYYF